MIVAIDIGSHKVCTLIGEMLADGSLRVLGVGHAPSAGLRRGDVVHVEDAGGAIALSLERAERVAGCSVGEAFVGISGTHIESTNGRAAIPCGRRPRTVETADEKRALEAAGAVALSAGREVLHVLPRSFVLDDGPPVISPRGMVGFRLEAHVHVVTAAAQALANLRRCLELAEVRPVGLTLNVLAAAEAVLTPDERELGAVVIDMGAATTSLACYRDGALTHSAVLPIGGRHLTSDLAVVLQTPLAQAERIKTVHGHALPELDDEATEIEIVPFGDEDRRVASRQLISQVLAARVDELGDMVGRELAHAELVGHLPAGAVLVGGGTELSGLPRRLYEKWEMPVRIGRPSGLAGLADAVKGPGHAGAVGLLLWAARGVGDAAAPPRERSSPAAADGMGRVLSWAREAFLPGDDDRHFGS